MVICSVPVVPVRVRVLSAQLPTLGGGGERVESRRIPLFRRLPLTALEPQVPYTAAVARKIVERIQPVEMVDREIRDGFGRCEANIYSHAPASIFLEA
jgi:hypothetical protein